MIGFLILGFHFGINLRMISLIGGTRLPVLNLSVMNPIGSIYPQPYVGPPGQVIVPGVGVMIGAPTAKSEK